MLLKATIPALLAAFVLPAQAQTGPAPGRPTMLIHGNYCGPGNNAPLAPIDALDAACARHDACTPDDGLPSRACNLRLQMDAERIASDGRQPEGLRQMAGLVAAGAAILPANPLGSYAVAPAASTTTGKHRATMPRRFSPGATELDEQ